jgi:hypothetical protein
MNKSEWENLSPEEFSILVNDLVKKYQTQGFPYLPTDFEYRKTEFKAFLDFDVTNIQTMYINNGDVEPTVHGLSLCWSYMPHAFNVRCNDKKTPTEVFNNSLRDAIIKRLNMGDNMSDSGLRKMLKIYSGAQAVSNFRPTAATVIYNKYANGGKVWDMSAGYGGRMLGFYKSSSTEYVGTDPCTDTFNGLQSLQKDFLSDKNINLFKVGSEDFEWDANYFDLCFTSPPYFDTEKYSDESTQSYIKFPNQQHWLNGFLGKTIENCRNYLKDDGKLVINLANLHKWTTLVDDVIELAFRKRFRYIKTERYLLSTMKTGQKYKSEPILIFEKR